MKLIARLSLLIALSAHLNSVAQASAGCPDLRGTYLCQQNSYRQDTHYVFDQVEDQGVVRYSMSANPPGGATVSSFEFLADGEYRNITDRITGQILNLKAQCVSGALDVSGTFKTDKGQIIRFAENLSLTEQGHLSNESLDINGKLVTEICDRVR